MESPAESSAYERVSVRSFTSCSNFLILSLIVMFCVFGYVDVTGGHDSHHPVKTQYFSHDSLMTAIAWFDDTERRCSVTDGSSKQEVAKPSKYSRLDLQVDS